MKIELHKDEYGVLVSPETVDYMLSIDKDEPSSPVFSIDHIETQDELEQAFVFAEKHECKRLFFISYAIGDNRDFSFKHLPYIRQFKSLDFDFSEKKMSLDLLPEGCNEITNVVYLRLTSSHPINFNQYLNFTHLKKLFVTYHKKSSGWLEHEGIIDLTIRKYKADDLTELSKMQSLKRLTLVQGSIKSLNGIENLKNLETLHINSVRNLTDLTALLKSTSIENLIFEAYSKVTDWDFLSEMKQLRQLNLKEANSIQFTKELPNLIFCYAEKIHDKNREPETIIQQRYEALNLPEGTSLPGFEQLVNVFEDD